MGATFTTGEIVAATGATLVREGAPDARVDAFEVDSRKVRPGSLFVALPGERVDGNGFAPAAIMAGARCVCLTEEPSSEVISVADAHGCALVRADHDDGEGFLLRLAAAWRGANPHWRVVAITGSVGKTTVKEMVASSVATTCRVFATVGNLNSTIGMPLTLLGVPAHAEVVVLEMGMNAAGEIARMSCCAHPECAVITNVGTSHIGMLGSRDAIADAKAEIISGMGGTDAGASTLVLSASDDYTPSIVERHALPAGVGVALVGQPGGNPRAEDITIDSGGRAHFALRFEDGCSRQMRLTIAGRHMVDDALLALAVADHLGIDRALAADAIEGMRPTHMRLEMREAPGRPRVIDDSYNASPASMAAALDVLASTACSGRRVAVLGEMGELGEQSMSLHGHVGAYAAATHPDLLVLIGSTLAEAMGAAARTMGLPGNQIQMFATVDEAVSSLSLELGEDDLVLAKGSRAAGLDAFVRGVICDAR